MKELFTLKGSRFRYKGDLSEEIIVYPSDKNDKHQDKCALVITPYTIKMILKAIKEMKEIPMGASRDNPPKNSLGYLLIKDDQTPQQLSYIIPIFIHSGLCTYRKEGNAFIIKYKGEI